MKTSQTLMGRLRQADDKDAQAMLVDLYTPFIRGWLRRLEIPLDGVDDLTQDVFVVLFRELPRFVHNGRPGAFRLWLRKIVQNQVRTWWRTRQAMAQGGDEAMRRIDELDDPNSRLSLRWDREHAEYLVGRAMRAAESEFEPWKLDAFRRIVWDGAEVADVALDLNVRPNLVSVWKCRILARLRREVGEFLE